MKSDIEPSFTVYETMTPFISTKKFGDVFDAVITYKVVEKTKNYVVLKITQVHPIKGRRLT